MGSDSNRDESSALHVLWDFTSSASCKEGNWPGWLVMSDGDTCDPSSPLLTQPKCTMHAQF